MKIKTKKEVVCREFIQFQQVSAVSTICVHYIYATDSTNVRVRVSLCIQNIESRKFDCLHCKFDDL